MIDIDMTALWQTLALCLISIVIEAVSATKDGKAWFEALTQPKYSFSFSFWYVVGGLYYLICGIIAYRQFEGTDSLLTWPLLILVLIMLFNGLTNFILFRYRSLYWFYIVLYPFAFLFLLVIILLYPQDMVSVMLGSIYLLWLLYDLYYFKRLYELNVEKGADSIK